MKNDKSLEPMLLAGPKGNHHLIKSKQQSGIFTINKKAKLQVSLLINN